MASAGANEAPVMPRYWASRCERSPIGTAMTFGAGSPTLRQPLPPQRGAHTTTPGEWSGSPSGLVPKRTPHCEPCGSSTASRRPPGYVRCCSSIGPIRSSGDELTRQPVPSSSLSARCRLARRHSCGLARQMNLPMSSARHRLASAARRFEAPSSGRMLDLCSPGSTSESGPALSPTARPPNPHSSRP